MHVVRSAICLTLAFVATTPAYAQQPDVIPGVGTIVKEMPKDLWRFLSVDTAIVLGAGGAAAGIAHMWDDDFKQEVETSVRLNDALEPGNTYGSFPFQVVIGP